MGRGDKNALSEDRILLEGMVFHGRHGTLPAERELGQPFVVDIELRLDPEPSQSVRGLAGLTLETAAGRHLELDRGAGGLRAKYRNRKGDQREWTVLGASRGEAGILGEGIRQALLRDQTYTPSLRIANALVP